jgi:glycosyltransferase involved in cell wall biosynthesis/GT2 family glycosyltransferase
MWFEPAQLANYLIRTISNPIGEPSNILIRRSAFADSSCLSRFAGLPISHLIDIAFMLNAAQRGPCAATGKYLSAFRQHADQVSSRNTAPGFSLGVLEWEVCLRGAVELGMVPPHAALDGVPRLEALYRRYGAPYPEIQHFFHQLPAMKDLLGAGDRQVLTPQFRADLQRAENTVKARAAAGDDAPPAAIEAAGFGCEAPRRVRANVDRLTRRGARGWAWIPDQPEQTVHVEAIVEDRVVGHAVADLHRPELTSWNVGTSNYGFELNFYEPLLGDAAPQFRFFTAAEWFAGETQLPPAGPGGGARREGAEAPLLEHARFTAPGPDFEEFDPVPAADRPRRLDGQDPLLIAFYLPQFHAIPENDQNWGQGFTEWRQLPRGIPRFPGHYQPRTPRDLGFYDLLDGQVIEAQCRMAQAAGVGAFAFYYYWFNGKRVLDRPVEIFLGSKTEMPFLIIWANENWTRGWDGLNENVLLKQDYNREDEDSLIADLARHMRDHRYVRIDGRPLFVIYNPAQIPDTARTLARWRQKWSDTQGLQPLIFMAQAFQREDPRPYGLDGALEFPPHKLTAHAPRREVFEAFSKDFGSEVIPYDRFVNASLSEAPPAFPLIKTLVPSWDNEARRPNRGLVLEGSTPRKYQAWLQALVAQAMERPVYGTPIVGINAWNEWAEGAYLEPDVHFGSAYLNATARALDAAIRKRNSAHLATSQGGRRSLPAEPDEALAGAESLLARGASRAGSEHNAKAKVSVICPCFNHSQFLPERLRTIVNQTHRPDEIIFLDDGSTDDSVAVARAWLDKSGIDFKIVANRTNSGNVFAQWLKGLELARNDLVWIAETDDAADLNLLESLAPRVRDNVLAAFARVQCLDEDGLPRHDLDNYYDNLRDFAWARPRTIPAYRAFTGDFAVKNVIPNVSGAIFRRPALNKAEQDRLLSYSFAGDWYFYLQALRGGAVAYVPEATSYFRVRSSSASRDALLTERHLKEHAMILADIEATYGLSDETLRRHASELAALFPDQPVEEMSRRLRPAERPDHKRALRVCVAAHGFGVGGGEIAPAHIANALSRRGHHVTYFVVENTDLDGEKHVRERLAANIAVFRWDRTAETFSAFVRDYGVQAVNSHNITVDVSLYLAGVQTLPAYVASLHGGYESAPGGLAADFINYVRKFDRWFYLTEKNLTPLRKNGVEAARFVRSFNAAPPPRKPGVDRTAVRTNYGIAESAFALVLASRAIPEKGWRTAIEVARQLHGLGRDIHLVLAGEGPRADELRQACAGERFVTFAGHVDDTAPLLAACDLALFPSTFAGESFPLFLLECLSVGLPILSTDMGEIPAMFGADEQQRPGRIFPSGLSADELAAAMAEVVLKAMDDPDLLSQWRGNAERAVERFDIEKLIDLYESTFRELLAQPPSKTPATPSRS